MVCLGKKQLGSTYPHELLFYDYSLIRQWSIYIYIPVWPKYLHSSSFSPQKFFCRSFKMNGRGKIRISLCCRTQITHFSETCRTLLEEFPVTSLFKRSTEGFLFAEGRCDQSWNCDNSWGCAAQFFLLSRQIIKVETHDELWLNYIGEAKSQLICNSLQAFWN